MKFKLEESRSILREAMSPEDRRDSDLIRSIGKKRSLPSGEYINYGNYQYDFSRKLTPQELEVIDKYNLYVPLIGEPRDKDYEKTKYLPYSSNVLLAYIDPSKSPNKYNLFTVWDEEEDSPKVNYADRARRTVEISNRREARKIGVDYYLPWPDDSNIIDPEEISKGLGLNMIDAEREVLNKRASHATRQAYFKKLRQKIKGEGGYIWNYKHDPTKSSPNKRTETGEEYLQRARKFIIDKYDIHPRDRGLIRIDPPKGYIGIYTAGNIANNIPPIKYIIRDLEKEGFRVLKHRNTGVSNIIYLDVPEE